MVVTEWSPVSLRLRGRTLHAAGTQDGWVPPHTAPRIGQQEQKKAKLVTPDQEEKPPANGDVLPTAPKGKPSRRAHRVEETFEESSPVSEQVPTCPWGAARQGTDPRVRPHLSARIAVKWADSGQRDVGRSDVINPTNPTKHPLAKLETKASKPSGDGRSRGGSILGH